MSYQYKSWSQISEREEVKPHVFPKYDKSTTDPTYYEPAASRIANMKKASGMKLEGIYDFYEKSELEKFNSENFNKNIMQANVDPRFKKGLTREEVSQVTQSMAQSVEKLVEDKKQSIQDKKSRIDETIAVNKAVNSDSSNSEN